MYLKYVLSMSVWLACYGSAAEPMVRIQGDATVRMPDAIVVPDSPTWHTSRITAVPDQSGKRSVDLREQTQSALKELSAELVQLGASPQEVIRLNIGLVDPNGAGVVSTVIEEVFPNEYRPVVTFVGSQMPEPDVQIALDAIARLPESATSVTGQLSRHGAICPSGSKVYISGKAANGDLATATRDTLRQIDDNLTYLKLSKSDIVQLRAFVSNVEEIDAYHREVREYFGDVALPAVTFTQWISSGYPVEIEAVVKDTSGVSVTEMEFLTPPGETASPVFCRVVRVPAGPLIYTAGLTGEQEADSAAQVSGIFDRLKPLLEESGTDFRHLAKATYFCGDDASSNALNAIRPSLYDPQRPPAASKAIVPHVGRTGHSVTLDWIAVPAH